MYDAYDWGRQVGQDVREGRREPLTTWRNADGSPIAWQTSDKSFPRGYRDGLAGVTR